MEWCRSLLLVGGRREEVPGSRKERRSLMRQLLGAVEWRGRCTSLRRVWERVSGGGAPPAA